LVELIIRESVGGGSAPFSSSAPTSPVGQGAPAGARAPPTQARASVGPVERQSR